ncbi:uncharacterized protein LOC128653046 [Bombina bombina]|uniref:uncharacterized protein LOC128653046 n=1 Tax=Bombina bombina TaxID=8345 RepID=UPI00235B0523|nr:uncharacterized protein LOC128653046 [Bombina bombina]
MAKNTLNDWRAARQNKYNNAFKENSHPSSNWETIISKLEKLYVKETKRWWETTFLSRYLNENLVPRGLRVYKIPAFGMNDKIFLDKWNAALHKCSTELVSLLYESQDISLKNIEKEIIALENELDTFLSDKRCLDKFEEIKSNAKQLDDQIGNSKYKKYLRDKDDFDKGIQYVQMQEENSNIQNNFAKGPHNKHSFSGDKQHIGNKPWEKNRVNYRTQQGSNRQSNHYDQNYDQHNGDRETYNRHTNSNSYRNYDAKQENRNTYNYDNRAHHKDSYPFPSNQNWDKHKSTPHTNQHWPQNNRFAPLQKDSPNTPVDRHTPQFRNQDSPIASTERYTPHFRNQDNRSNPRKRERTPIQLEGEGEVEARHMRKRHF